jgi:hypothetical protein
VESSSLLQQRNKYSNTLCSLKTKTAKGKAVPVLKNGKRYTIKTYGVVSVEIHVYLTSARVGDEL